MAFWLETVVGYKMKTHQNGMAYICSALPDSSGKWRLSLGSTNLKKVSHNPGGDCNCYWGKPTFVSFTSFLPKWSTTTTPDKISNTKKTDKPDNSAANHHTVVLFQVLVLVGPFRKKNTHKTHKTPRCVYVFVVRSQRHRCLAHPQAPRNWRRSRRDSETKCPRSWSNRACSCRWKLGFLPKHSMDNEGPKWLPASYKWIKDVVREDTQMQSKKNQKVVFFFQPSWMFSP